MIKQYLALILLGGLMITSAHAQTKQKNSYKILPSTTYAVEATNIRMLFSANQQTGTVFVSGCTQCPLNLKIIPQTHLSYGGKTITRKKATRYSGRGGTVIYKDNNEVSEIDIFKSGN